MVNFESKDTRLDWSDVNEYLNIRGYDVKRQGNKVIGSVKTSEKNDDGEWVERKTTIEFKPVIIASIKDEYSLTGPYSHPESNYKMEKMRDELDSNVCEVGVGYIDDNKSQMELKCNYDVNMGSQARWDDKFSLLDTRKFNVEKKIEHMSSVWKETVVPEYYIDEFYDEDDDDDYDD